MKKYAPCSNTDKAVDKEKRKDLIIDLSICAVGVALLVFRFCFLTSSEILSGDFQSPQTRLKCGLTGIIRRSVSSPLRASSVGSTGKRSPGPFSVSVSPLFLHVKSSSTRYE